MGHMTSSEIRRQFIEFFEGKDHTFVASSAVVPYDDPTLMFTNAGMNQFKDVFLGTGKRDYARAANSQKCIRAGGKHNDLDDVGHDTYHHTFFEMLGNWSFGDYFKAEAIAWAWELLTDKWGIDKTRLHATVFAGEQAEGVPADDEAAELWRQVTDIDPDHIHYFGKKDNFWEMGNTGPCGPCSEIHIDLTPDKSGAGRVNADDPTVMEIWNLVFIQYNRTGPTTLIPLPAKHVDTGMGFERVSALLQGKTSNYDTDVFTPLFEAIHVATGAPSYGGRLERSGQQDADVLRDVAYRVIADHLRCLSFAIADGCPPSNEKRGYVLRRILRRAVRYGRQYLDVHEPFLSKLVPTVATTMGGAFPEIIHHQDRVAAIIHDEEESFGRTYERGVRLFGEAAAQSSGQIAAETAFKLHDTYGFPIDLTTIMAEERGMQVDVGGYDALMEQAKEKARAGGVKEDGFNRNITSELPPTDDTPKFEGLSAAARVVGFIKDGEFVTSGRVHADTPIALILDRTCFYGEQGGQIGDQGVIETAASGDAAVFEVHDTQRHGDAVLHIGCLSESTDVLNVGAAVTAVVSRDHRPEIMRNHTATHVMNWALREVLGDHVDQKGSLVDEDKTRFDFSHPRALSATELAGIEEQCDRQITDNLKVHTAEVAEADARKINTLRAVFGEKYPEIVRVVSIGQPVDALLAAPDNAEWMKYSVEFCGGTHLGSTGEIGGFSIIDETAVAKGVRRVMAVTGERAGTALALGEDLKAAVIALERADVDRLVAELPGLSRRVNAEEYSYALKQRLRDAVAALQKKAKEHAKVQDRAGGAGVQEAARRLLDAARAVGQTRVIVGQLAEAKPEQIREAIDMMRREAGSAAIFIGCPAGPKVLLFAAMTDDVVERGLSAGQLIKEVAPIVGGGGGGKPQLAQAGGKDPAALPQALERALEIIGSGLQA